MENKYCLAIIGAGPAGMAAAIDAQNNRLNFILIEPRKPGWYPEAVINQHFEVDGYLGAYQTTGTELTNSFIKHLAIKNIKPITMNVKSITESGPFIIKTDQGKVTSEYVILATGTKPLPLPVDNFKKYLNNGVYYFVTMLEKFPVTKNIVVVGGRNSGVTTALFLSKQTNIPIYLVEKDAQINATTKYQERLAQTSVKILTNSYVTELKGETELENVVICNDGKNFELNCALMFSCIGMEANTTIFDDLKLEKALNGNIIVNPKNMETSNINCYATGDINNLYPKQVSNATAQGKTAVYYINKKVNL